jgi:hypothetical protein
MAYFPGPKQKVQPNQPPSQKIKEKRDALSKLHAHKRFSSQPVNVNKVTTAEKPVSNERPGSQVHHAKPQAKAAEELAFAEIVMLLKSSSDRAARLMVLWAEKYQKSSLHITTAIVVGALDGSSVVDVIRLRERFMLLQGDGSLSKMDEGISKVIADGFREAEARKAKVIGDEEVKKNVGAARFIRTLLTGQEGVEPIYPFEQKNLDKVLEGRSLEDIRALKDAVEDYKGTLALAMLNRSLPVYEERALSEKYLLRKPLDVQPNRWPAQILSEPSGVAPTAAEEKLAEKYLLKKPLV